MAGNQTLSINSSVSTRGAWPIEFDPGIKVGQGTARSSAVNGLMAYCDTIIACRMTSSDIELKLQFRLKSALRRVKRFLTDVDGQSGEIE